MSSLEININQLNCRVECSLFKYWTMLDEINNFSSHFESGKIYALVGKGWNGGWALSYFLTGRSEENERCYDSVYVNGEKANSLLFRKIACYIGEGVSEHPFQSIKRYRNKFTRKLFGIKTVAEQIQQGILFSNNRYSYEDVAAMFELTGVYEHDERNGRIHRPLAYQGNEIWRASMAIGFAYGKKVYAAPLMMPNKDWLNYIIGDYNRRYIELLRSHNSIIIIPVHNDQQVKNWADEIIYL